MDSALCPRRFVYKPTKVRQMQQTKLVGLQLLLLFLFYRKCYDFSKPRVPQMQAASRQGETTEDAQIEHVLLIDT